MRKLVDKANGVGKKNRLSAGQIVFSRSGIKRCEKLVLGKYPRICHSVEQSGLARVGISYDSYLHDPASVARSPHRASVLVHLGDLRLKRVYSALHMSAVGLKL